MKLLTVFTGGTISCSVSDGVLAPDSQNGSYLLGLARQAGVRDDFETVQPFSVLSENMTPDYLRQLRRCITERLGEGYDGVIVTHGTDTLAYTAAYLDFVLGAQDTPVVLVSANYPLRDSRSNGLQNFVAAVELLRTGKRGVFVAYHNTGDSRTTIHRGREVLPQAPYEDSLFSLFMQPCGWIENGVWTENPCHTECAWEDLSACELNGRVLFLRPYVGMVYPALPDVKAVLLEGWHSGTLPTATEELRAFCRAAKKKGVGVYLTGSRAGFAYESKRLFDALDIRVMEPMSPSAAYVYLMLNS